jgi:hypothetical protein
LRGPIR